MDNYDMKYILDFDTYINESKEYNNASLFTNAMKYKGYTCADVLKRLNDKNIHDFDTVITDSDFVLPEITKKLTSKEKHAVGGRDPREAKLACIVGNIQEALFTLNNGEFERNAKATNINSDSDITKEEDLIFKPTKTKVEFKVSFCRLNNDKGRYNHRDGGFKRCMKSGQIMIIYFIYLDKVAVIDKSCLDNGTVQIDKENFKSEKMGKVIDIIYIDQKLFIDYDLMSNKKYSEISDRVSNMIKERKERDKEMGNIKFTGNPDVDPYLNDKVYSQEKTHFYVDVDKTAESGNDIYKFNPYEEAQDEGSEYRKIWLELVDDIKEDNKLSNKTVQEKDDILLKRFSQKLNNLENLVRADDPNLYMNQSKSSKTWYAENYNKCMEKWKSIVDDVKQKYPGKNDSVKRGNEARVRFFKFANGLGISDKWAGKIISRVSKAYPLD